MSFLNSKFCLIVLAVNTVLLLIIGGVGPVIIEEVIKKRTEDRVIMKESNYKYWGQTPGKTGVKILRNFTYYNFTNHEDVIFSGAKPIFKEVGPFSFWEERDFTDRQYIDDGKVVKFNFWQYFKPAEQYGTTGEEDLDIINVGPMGAWEQLKNSSPPQIALSVLSSLFSSLNESFQTSVLASQFGKNTLSNYDQNTIKAALTGIDGTLLDTQKNAIASDPTYGMGSSAGLKVWVDSVFGEVVNGAIPNIKPPGGSFTVLQNYFGLTFDQMDKIYKWVFSGTPGGIKNLYSLVIKQNYCDAADLQNYNCDHLLFSAAQWSQQRITGPTVSISQTNATSFGAPEISYYYSQVFSNMASTNPYKVSSDATFKVTFGIEWAKKVMSYKTDGTFTTEPEALLNIGNLAALFKLGAAFDQSQESYDVSPDLASMQQKFQLESKKHTYVFWNYMKYIVAELGHQATIGGNQHNAVLGGFTAQGVSKTFQGLSDFLLPTLTAAMMEQPLKQYTCNKLLTNAGATEQLATGICKNMLNSDGQPLNPKAIIGVNQLCMRENWPVYNQLVSFIQSKALTENLLNQLCDQTTAPIGLTFKGVSMKLSSHYQCSGLSYKCSNWEFAAKQWAYGSITKNVQSDLLKVFKPSDSISAWFPTIFSKPIEFYAICNKYKNNFKTSTIFAPTFEQLKSILSYNKIFSKTLIGNSFVWAKKKETENQIGNHLIITEVDQLLTYFRYVAIEITFGGFKTRVKSKEAFFGYKDSFLDSLKSRNPQLGGNPSASNIVVLNEPNPTYEERVNFPQAMYTGKGDIKKVKNYHSFMDEHDYIAQQQQIFDGKVTYNVKRNPWEQEIPLLSNDGSQSHPFQEDGDKIKVFVQSLFFSTELKQKKSVEHQGLDCFRYEIGPEVLANKTTNPNNQGQYFDGYDGLLNVTKAKKPPIFASLTHFYYGDPQLQNNITLYNKDGNLQYANKWDKTYMHSEKYSGVTLSVVLNMQINYEMKPDILFPIEFTRYLPVYYVYRSANWTESQVDDRFSQLKAALAGKLALLIIGFSLGGIMFFATILMTYRYYKLTKLKTISQQNLNDVEYQKGAENEAGGSANDFYSQNKVMETEKQ